MTWQTTHKVTFTPAGGGDEMQWLVMLCKDPYSQEYLVGLTEEEWLKGKAPHWRMARAGEVWTWKGHPTPYGKAGSVSIERIGPDQKPSTLRFAKPPTRLRDQPQSS